MEIKSCKFCKKTFQGFGILCQVCVEELDKKYIAVRNYLDRNSDSNISRVAEDTGVDEKSLLFLIREGRLTLREGSTAVTCMKCGIPILSGKYCDKCKDALMRTLESTKNLMESNKKLANPKGGQATDTKGKMHMLKD